MNLTAIEEHRELTERHEFLSGQKDDLERSLLQLREAISRMNRTSRQRFRETFDLVNERFSQVFPRLFAGGKAELQLVTDTERWRPARGGHRDHRPAAGQEPAEPWACSRAARRRSPPSR